MASRSMYESYVSSGVASMTTVAARSTHSATAAAARGRRDRWRCGRRADRAGSDAAPGDRVDGAGSRIGGRKASGIGAAHALGLGVGLGLFSSGCWMDARKKVDGKVRSGVIAGGGSARREGWDQYSVALRLGSRSPNVS